jgi:DNA repair protein RecO
MPGKIKTNCVLLKKQPYSETSILMQVISDTLGMISVLAKAMRKGKEHNDYLLNVLNEYEFVVSTASPSGIHTLGEMTLLEEYPTDLPLDTWFAAQAGAEILTKLVLPDEEMPLFYKALKQYLTYLKSVPVNPLAIFWRYVLHLDKLLGVPINLSTCSTCYKDMDRPAGYSPETGQLLCGNCSILFPASYSLTPESRSILALLPVVGNYLNDLVITPETARQINRFMLNYISVQFHKKILLNSLQFFEPK